MHIPSHSVHTAAHCNHLQPKAKHPVHTLQEPLHIQCTHCSSHYILSAHTAAAITSSVHTLAMYSYVQLSAANLQCTLQPYIPMYSYLQPIFSAHCSQLQPSMTTYTAAILSSAHCSYSIQCTLQLYYQVHTTAILSSAHYSYTIQCTLQLFYPVHTAAILSSTHCSYTIQCTLQLYYPVHTAAILSQCTLQLYYPVHTAAILSQCTLQLFYPVHTAAILSSAHCSYSIQCTLQLHYLYSTSSAPLNHHRVSLYHYWHTSRAVSRH